MTTTINGSNADDVIDKSTSKDAININGLSGDDELMSGNGNDAIDGGLGSDYIFTGAGKDTLIGGVGADYLAGGLGDDVYLVGEEDVVAEEFNEGVDLVRTAFDYLLGDGVENLELLDQAETGAGNALNNKITGNGAANTLIGWEGTDTLIGGDGDDTYQVDLLQGAVASGVANAIYADSVIEAANNGIDTIKLFGNFQGVEGQELTSIILNLGLIQNTEHLDVSDITANGDVDLAITLTGNSVANRLVGNDLANTFDGGQESGASIQDTLIGGAGDDLYIVDLINDNGAGIFQDDVVESADAGNDTLTLRGQVVFNANATIGLVANTENIDASLTGFTKLNLQGNAADNSLTGNTANNLLTGDAGADTLDGGDGVDTLEGGEGDDTYVLDESDTVIETSLGGIDTIQTDASSFDLGEANGNNIENLTYTGIQSFSGYGNTLDNIITSAQGDDLIQGDEGDDQLNGGTGDDTLDGGNGFDILSGEDGDDTYLIDSDDLIIEYEEAGIDTVEVSFDYTLDDNIENLVLLGDAITANGNALNNRLEGNAEANILHGGDGKDTLIGGEGDDVYHVAISQSGETTQAFKLQHDDTVIEDANAGNDSIIVSAYISGVPDTDLIHVTINAALTANLENLDVSNVVSDSSVDLKVNLTGNNLANVLIANASDNLLDGGAGISGVTAIDTLIGGEGDDTYLVDIIQSGSSFVVQDVIEDNSGSDTLQLRGVYTNAEAYEIQLLPEIENIDASNTSSTKLNLSGNDEANRLVGNLANNLILGAAGDDTLVGGGGRDTLEGGEGNDYYVIDASDVVVEDDIEGSFDDTVAVNFSFNLTAANLALIENLVLTGTAAINGYGNAMGNHLLGNSAANFLSGAAGNDNLDGGSGNDTLDGGAGADTLTGGLGNDVYFVDNVADVVAEEGIVEVNGEFIDKDIDKIISSVSYDLSNLPQVEHLTLVGDALNATGNDLSNLLEGNAANNQLIGGQGVDTLKGGKGDDTYIVDIVQIGDDATAKIKLEDVVAEAVNGGFDSIVLTGMFNSLVTFTQITLGANIEKLDASGTGETLLNITGNALNNYLVGNEAANILSGATGNDTIEGGNGDRLVGGAGNDTYRLRSEISYQIVEAAGGGFDTIEIDTDYVLGLELESLTLTGVADFNGTGNKVANFLNGNTGNNYLYGLLGNDTLVGGLGMDTLVGGAGNDTYIFEGGAEVVIENANEGIDLIKSNGSLNLGDYLYVEQLTLTGSSNLSAVGNNAANLLVGNSGANVLHGGLGVDTLHGGAGNDIYEVNLMQSAANVLTAVAKLEDIVSESANQGDDTLVLSNEILLSKVSTLTMAANIEHMDTSASGSTKLNLFGNGLHNQIMGNDFSNNINGALGNDTLNGGAGADTLIGAAGNDQLHGGADGDRLDGGVGVDALYGGTGADVFVFNSALTNNRDSISDFVSGEDVVELDRSFFTKLTVGNLSVNNFVEGAPMDVNDYIVYDSNTGNLYYDPDGNGNLSGFNFAMLEGIQNITFNDFVVVA